MTMFGCIKSSFCFPDGAFQLLAYANAKHWLKMQMPIYFSWKPVVTHTQILLEDHSNIAQNIAIRQVQIYHTLDLYVFKISHSGNCSSYPKDINH